MHTYKLGFAFLDDIVYSIASTNIYGDVKLIQLYKHKEYITLPFVIRTQYHILNQTYKLHEYL